MSWFHRRVIAVAAMGFGLAAIFGATLGVAVAKHSSTVGGVCAGGAQGCNIHYVGVIKSGGVSPAKFTECLPSGSWSAIYTWDGPSQKWLHHFNTTGTGVPSYVNNTSAGGISTIPGFSGVVLIMKLGTPIQSVTLLDANNESC
jgi:hypothetical protein